MRPSNGLTAYVLEMAFGCLTMVVLFAGLCSILWRRRRKSNRPCFADQWKKFGKKIFHYSGSSDEDGRVKRVVPDVELGGVVNAAKVFSDDEEGEGEEEELADYLVSAGLIGLQSRLLFTIMEESREDLDSSIGEVSKRLSITRSLSDLGSFSSRRMLESVPSSPPSKFKFLRDAEQKFQTRMKMEAQEKEIGIGMTQPSQVSSPVVKKDDSRSKILERRKVSDVLLQIAQNHPSFRVLPLEFSSP